MSTPTFVAKSPASMRSARASKRVSRGKWKKRLLRAGVVSIVLCGALGYGVARVPWVGAMGADVARKVLGAENVAKLEDTVYGLADTYNQWRYKDKPPPSYWSAPPEGSAASGSSGSSGPSGNNNGGMPPVLPAASAIASGATALGVAVAAPPPPRDPSQVFPPANFAPMISNVSGKVDGTWITIADDVDAASPPVMAKTLVHPDPTRPYAQVAIVAIDLARVRIVSVPGTEEPASSTVKRADRPGKIPDAEQPNLVAAFNGGWQAVHGAFGMMVDGKELLPPKDSSCTVVLNKDRSMRIAPWPDVAADREQMQAFRQTPPCLVQDGIEHRGMSEGSRNWGAAVDGATVIRRSGLGLDKDKKILFYASGDSLSVLTLARAMTAAGASDVAELDVNWSFPRFLFYKHGVAAPEVRESLIPCTFRKNEHTGISYYRDYFYVVRDTPVVLGSR